MASEIDHATDLEFISGGVTTAVISTTGVITANAFIGDGMGLTNFSSGVITSVVDDFYVNVSGDVMTGGLIISNMLVVGDNTNTLGQQLGVAFGRDSLASGVSSFA